MSKKDKVIEEIAAYVCKKADFSPLAIETAHHALADTMGCAILALQFPACTKLLGPRFGETPKGAKIPGTPYTLDPIEAAFNFGTMLRWLDFNDTWLAKEWGHPSDNLGAIWTLADYLDRNGSKIQVKQILNWMIQAYEIQGILALNTSLNQVGFDHVLFVKVATAAITCRMLGGTESQVADALSHAFIDAGPLRTYRHFPNTGSRKSWAAGDQARRGLELALLVIRGEMGYDTPLTAKTWGFDACITPVTLERTLECYVMENILFKVAYPAEFHAQTAVEAALQIKCDCDKIKKIEIGTHAACLRIIDKKGPLTNPADRDHCIQYMVACALLFGTLEAGHYEDATHKNPNVDRLREKMVLSEVPEYSKDYLDPNKRSIANALTITLTSGEKIGPVIVKYPLGHRVRRNEGIPLLYQKLKTNLESHYTKKKADELMTLFKDSQKLKGIRVSTVGDLLC